VSPRDIVEYSMHIYLKSGKVLASDPVKMELYRTEEEMVLSWESFLDPTWKGSHITRNGRFVIVPRDSIDYIEFHVDVPDAHS
jgi:hypothetical protein